jgi:hypothetical protein
MIVRGGTSSVELIAKSIVIEFHISCSKRASNKDKTHHVYDYIRAEASFAS